MIDAREQEQTLIGSLLMSPDKIDDVRGIVTAEDFTEAGCGKLFRFMLTFWDAGGSISDTTLFINELEKSGLGGAQSLVVQCGTKAATHATYYAGEIRRRAQYRQLQQITEDVQRQIGKGSEPIDALVEYVETRLCELQQSGDQKPRPVGQVAIEQLAAMKRADGAKSGGIGSGCSLHDAEFGLWFPGELITLAARPGVGKSKLAEQIAGYQSDKGRAVLVVSLEMKEGEWVDRMLCTLAEIDNRQLRAGRRLDSEAMAELEAAAHELQTSLVSIWSPAGANVPEIRSKARALKAREPLRLIIVDYLQRLRHPNRKLSAYERVSDNVMALKFLAQDLSVPVLALCQLNREAERTDEPTLDHLRDSGQVEQESDEVIMLGRQRDQSETKMHVRKHRNAPPGTLDLTFDGITGFSGFPLSQFENFNGGKSYD